jgi:hypothetical protein
MQVAAPWVGGFGLVLVAVGATASLVVTAASPHEARGNRWTAMTFRGYVTGRDYELPPEVKLRELRADEEALAACMDAWPGKLAIRPVPVLPGAHFVQVEEGTLLDQCLQVRHYQDSRFGQGVWTSTPADATMNVPTHLGSARTRGFDAFRYEREREAAALADGEILAVSCPEQKRSTSEGLPSYEFHVALRHCMSHGEGP